MSGKHEMLRANLSNIRESLGDFDRSATAPTAGPRATPAKLLGVTRSRDVSEIEIDRIVPDPDQPRKEFDVEALERLAESLRRKGQLQPIQVRWDEGSGRYVVLLGERRWRAAGIAGLAKLQCVVREAPLGDDERLAIQVVENCLREDLTAMEQSHAFRALMDREGWTMERLAEELAVSKSHVVKTLSLLKLPESVQRQVEQGGLGSSAAYQIAKLDDPREQVRMAAAAVDQGLTRDDLARQIRTPKSGRKTTAKATKRRAPQVRVLRFGGYKITLEKKTGVETDSAVQALSEAIRSLEGERRGDADVAA
ncbi:ParB/RepB/Spo0J family partition protein [Paludisphaera mucosa]|uniref:ParB/RepB/Spo0J family partition protein n=1 Tax=Paludisphaera mucosa TaxID=3030827 RepID=A0ABT6FLC3_9BACT|nr:ParB/RepB/Spo0J family partition protein [Paludisphaera mucosa]MDG3008371.1 ParB/RepB/Spo0J family partition protein [Paludisphaera mucosa]